MGFLVVVYCWGYPFSGLLLGNIGCGGLLLVLRTDVLVERTWDRGAEVVE